MTPSQSQANLSHTSQSHAGPSHAGLSHAPRPRRCAARLPLSLAGLAALALLAGCVEPEAPRERPRNGGNAGYTSAGPALSPEVAAANFSAVVRRMEPVIEEECLARTKGVNCDYQIFVDDSPAKGPNAFQTVDKRGRPIIAFNIPLIAEARNQDELAFVMGHEAAHHIAGHLKLQSRSAETGSLIFGAIAAAYGNDPQTVQTAQSIGAAVGARTYSKDYELEADRLGAVIAWDAGFDPLRGAQFFSRLPDPGDEFLGSHPPNGARVATVRNVVAQLQAGQRL